MTSADGAPRASAPLKRETEYCEGLIKQVELLATGTITSVELTRRALEKIDATQSTLNAFRVVRHDAAMREAEQADRRLAAGERLPLLGVPTVIKDDTDLAGETTPYGCPGEFDACTEDSAVVCQLREAGAVILGKTNAPEVAQWPVTATTAYGITRNPWNQNFTPGGSSGGTATAIAAGIVAAGVGSDGAGSIRIPAAWTNLVGIKPQRDRVSTWPNINLFNGLAVFGPLARTVEDAAYLLDVLSGNRPEDANKPPMPEQPFVDYAGRKPGKLRIALALRAPFSAFPSRLHPEVRAGIERLAGVLKDLGHDVVVKSPRYGLIGAAFMPASMGGVRDWVAKMPDASLLEARTIHNSKVGRILGGPLLKLARAAEPLLHRQVGAIFKQFDVVLAPTTAKPPLEANALDGLGATATDRKVVAACPYAWPWNVLGWPGINVPAGFTDRGLPFGAQLLGPANSEPLLISLAAQLEQVERWQDQWPTAADRPAPVTA